MTADRPPTTADLAAYGIESHWLRPAPASRRMLIIYAHPDDESFGNGGTIARYSAAGVAVHYACATRGECGSVAAEHLAGHADIAALRSGELLNAARTLGMAAVHWLGYRDSGMEGSADNQHPAAFVQAPLAQVTGQMVALIRAIRPQVVVAFPPYGGYGHPDHIAAHHASVAAFRQAGDPAAYPEQLAAGLEVWAPQKLYYSTFKTRIIKIALLGMRLMGKNPRKVGANSDIDVLRVVEEATPIDAAVSCGRYLAIRDQAWRCHGSQLGGMASMMKLPVWLRRLFGTAEHFTRVVPPPRQQIETDLFSGV